MSIYGLSSVTPSTAVIAQEILDYLDANGTPLAPHPNVGKQVIWGYDPNPGNSEHHTGRAIDIMVTGNTSRGDIIADYVWKHRDRLGLVHVIWRQRIKSTVTSPGVWRWMADRGSPTENHMDHPHILFDGRSVAGSAPREKYWKPTGTLTTKQIQKLVGVTVDGYYGNDTIVAVKRLQEKLGVTADGYFGPSTEAAHKRAPSRPSRKPARKPIKRAPKFPLPRGHYFGPKSGPDSSVSGYYGDRAALKKWQAQMRKRGWTLDADGYFGPRTAAVALAFQKEKRLAQDSFVGAETWAAAWTEDVT